MQTISHFQSESPQECVNTLFPEEPLHLSADQGFGFFPARAGLLLNSGRYKILRKLGRGQFSNTWLVSDQCVYVSATLARLSVSHSTRAQEKPFYYAVKILTAHATKGHRDGHSHELGIMAAIRGLEGYLSLRLPDLFDHFETESPHGRHLCLVMRVLSSDATHFRCSAPSKRLGFQTVKIIIAQVLEALVALHAVGIVHAGGSLMHDYCEIAPYTPPQILSQTTCSSVMVQPQRLFRNY
jgi:serine/threonine-protein kinase SRPK3